MTTPLFHLTLPDTDGPAHFAPLQIALEGMTKINEWHIRRSLKRAAKGESEGVIPPLYASGVVYKEDPPGEENWKDCYAVMRDGHGDCVPVSTLVLTNDWRLVPIASLVPGDRIMGAGVWTEVRERVITGEKSILVFRLSNGCALRCSPDHRLFRDVAGVVEEIRAADARVGDDLITPRAVPMSSATSPMPTALMRLAPVDRAWLLGVFVADGWVDQQECRASISGQDACPKEDQKRRVEALMKSIDVPTRWHRKYITINDRSIAEFFATCGHTAPNKHLPSLHFGTREEIEAVLSGLAADASFETREGKTPGLVYGTTSATLALQYRALHRMLGQSVSIRRVDEHGGFGEHPIYRVTPRLRTKEGTAERRDKIFARVRSISDGGVELCADIETDSGKFWLPESDVVVHNCDRLAAWRAGELRAAGIAAEAVLKWQWIPRAIMLGMGYPARLLGNSPGVWMVHCLVRFPDGTTEDPSKILGMGGNFTSQI